MTALEKWESGIPLNVAFDTLCEPYQRDKFRSARDMGAIQTYKALMYAGLFGKLESRELAAFGFRISPTPSDGPVQIPHHVFEPRPDVSEADANVVTASGFKYERVHILAEPPVVQAILPGDVPNERPGRPSTYDKARTVLAALFETESNRAKPAAKLHADFKTEFESQYPQAEWSIAAPSERILRDHLKRYRSELAKNGGNDLAN